MRTGLLIGAVVFLLALIGIVVSGFFLVGALNGNEDIAITQAKILTLACDKHFEVFGSLPVNLEALLEKKEGRGPFLADRDSITDPWGKPYLYDPKGPKNDGKKPDIWTTTPKGKLIRNWPTNR